MRSKHYYVKKIYLQINVFECLSRENTTRGEAAEKKKLPSNDTF